MYLIDVPYVSNFILIQKDNKFNTLKKIPISTLSNKLIKDISFYTVKTNNNVEVPLPILNNKIIKIKNKLICANELMKRIPHLKYIYISSSFKGKREKVFYICNNNTIFINFKFDKVYDFSTYYNIFAVFKNEENKILLSYFNIFKFTSNVLNGYIIFKFNSNHLKSGSYYIDLYINGIRYFSKDIEFRNLLYQLK